MEITEKEFENVVKLAALDRYKYAMKRIADWEELYVLKGSNDDYALAALDEISLFPIWSGDLFAQRMITEEWAGYTSYIITLVEFDDVIDNFILPRGLLISVFPVLDKTGFVISPKEFRRDMDVELSQY